MDEGLPKLKNYILRGGSKCSSALHIARTICRGGERLLHRLHAEEGNINDLAVKYANRLSDDLFTLARWVNLREGSVEIKWINAKR